MPAPYSIDLRERVVRAYLSGNVTYADVAARFEVGEATVDRWMARYRRTTSVAPDPMGGDRHSKFDEASEQALRTFVEEDSDITRDELVRALAERGLVVSASTVQRALERNELTRKKRPSTPPSVTPTSSGPSEISTSKR